MTNTFRYSLHRNSPAIGNIIRNVQRYGYFYKDGKKLKLVNATKDGVNINLEVMTL